MPSLSYGTDGRGRRQSVQKISEYYEEKKNVDQNMEIDHFYPVIGTDYFDSTQCHILSWDTLVADEWGSDFIFVSVIVSDDITSG